MGHRLPSVLLGMCPGVMFASGLVTHGTTPYRRGGFGRFLGARNNIRRVSIMQLQFLQWGPPLLEHGQVGQVQRPWGKWDAAAHVTNGNHFEILQLCLRSTRVVKGQSPHTTNHLPSECLSLSKLYAHSSCEIPRMLLPERTCSNLQLFHVNSLIHHSQSIACQQPAGVRPPRPPWSPSSWRRYSRT